MHFGLGQLIHRKLSRKGFAPAHVAEVGVYHPETSNVLDYIEAGVRATLIEPDPESIELIHERLDGYDNVTLIPVAIGDQRGRLTLVQRGASTYVRGVASPAQINDGYAPGAQDELEVDSVPMNELDDGSIDLLSVDTEGSEWTVIKNLTSHPAVLSVETHGAAYVNPNLQSILQWCRERGYQILYKDKTDTVFVRPEAVRVTPWDRLRLRITDARIRLRRARKQRRQRN